MARIIKPSEWAGTDTVAHARELLGKWLAITGADGARRAVRIIETEAYDGLADRASHAFRGRTVRNEVMFGAPGHWYVYLCYGIHEMLNLVTGPRNYPAAVLVRGVSGFPGPGRLTRQLGIDRRFNRQPAQRVTGLWLEDDGLKVPDREVECTARIGIAYAGEEWAAKPWRFVWRDGARG